MSAKLLLVEDDPAARQLTAEVLASLGHVVDAIGDGREALALIQSGAYDVVLLDLTLPSVSGDELFCIIRETDCPAQVVFVTADADPTRAAALLEAGAVDYLVKPVSREALDKAVHAALRCQRLVLAKDARIKELEDLMAALVAKVEGPAAEQARRQSEVELGMLRTDLAEARAEAEELQRRLADVGVAPQPRPEPRSAEPSRPAPVPGHGASHAELVQLRREMSEKESSLRALQVRSEGFLGQLDDEVNRFESAAGGAHHGYLTGLVGGGCAVLGACAVGFGALGHLLVPPPPELVAARVDFARVALLAGAALLLLALLVGLRSLLDRFAKPVATVDPPLPFDRTLSSGGTVVVLAGLLLFLLALVLLLFGNGGVGLVALLRLDFAGFAAAVAQNGLAGWCAISLFCATVLLAAACAGTTVRCHFGYFRSLRAYAAHLRARAA